MNETDRQKLHLRDYGAIYRQMVELQNRHWWFRVHYAWMEDILKPYLTAGARVLDMGCGPGIGTAKLSGFVFRLLLDIRFFSPGDPNCGFGAL